MNVVVSWALAVLSALLLIGLVAYARGHEHHRGNEVGSFPAIVLIATVR
jgi:hypothetical protein